MVKRLILAALLTSTLLLTACQTTGGSSFCDIARPIRPTTEQIDQLTDEQVRQLLGHNEKGARLCGWKH